MLRPQETAPPWAAVFGHALVDRLGRWPWLRVAALDPASPAGLVPGYTAAALHDRKARRAEVGEAGAPAGSTPERGAILSVGRSVVGDRGQPGRLTPPGLCDRYGDAVCVDIQADESYVFHGWTRLPLWLCAVEYPSAE
jgi:hypothetical protein